MTKHIKTIALAYEAPFAKVMALLTLVIVLSVFLYGIFLLEAVAHTASRAQAGEQIRALSAKLGHLEAVYLSKTQDMNPTRARELGFVAPSEVTVVFAKTDTPLSVALR